MARVFCATLFLVMSASFETGSGQSWTPSACFAGLDGVRVVDACAAGAEEAEVAIHGVLIERDEELESVAHVGDGVGAGADGEEGMATADDGLIGVIGVEVQAATREDFREDVAGGGDALAGGASNADGECLTHGAGTPILNCDQNTSASGRLDRGGCAQ
jgi:hypothetical protein